jgi:hypothetical protein
MPKNQSEHSVRSFLQKHKKLAILPIRTPTNSLISKKLAKRIFFDRFEALGLCLM